MKIEDKVNLSMLLFSFVAIFGMYSLTLFVSNIYAVAAGSFAIGYIFVVATFWANEEYIKRGYIK